MCSSPTSLTGPLLTARGCRSTLRMRSTLVAMVLTHTIRPHQTQLSLRTSLEAICSSSSSLDSAKPRIQTSTTRTWWTISTWLAMTMAYTTSGQTLRVSLWTSRVLVSLQTLSPSLLTCLLLLQRDSLLALQRLVGTALCWTHARITKTLVFGITTLESSLILCSTTITSGFPLLLLLPTQKLSTVNVWSM